MTGEPLHPFVIKFGRIGDMVMLTATLRLLHARYGKPCYVVGADAWAPNVFSGLDEVAKCWSVPRKAPIPLGLAWPAILRTLRASAPGPVYICEHHPLQVRRIRRLLRAGGVDPNRCLFIEEAPGTEQPWIEAFLRLARRTPIALSPADYPEPVGGVKWTPRLRIIDAERAARDHWLAARGFRGQPLVIVQPGNHRTMGRRRQRNWRGRDDKIWPIERWVQLLHLIHRRMPQALLVLRGAAAETPLLEAVRAAAALPSVTCASTELRPLFALCEGAHSMISVDSGPAHAAAAVGLPLIVLYGMQSRRVWLPRSSNGSPVVALGGPPELERVEQIPVAAVFAAWCQVADQATAHAGLERPAAPPSIQMTSVTMEPSALSSSVR